MTRGPSLVILETDLESPETHSRQASKGSREIPPLLSPYVPRAAPSLVTQLETAGVTIAPPLHQAPARR